MITVTKQQIVDFINAQPASRRVNMSQNYSYESCGCVMVHYGKDVLKLDNFGCGFNRWHISGADMNECYAGILNEDDDYDLTIVDIVGSWHRPGIQMDNYGGLQKILGGQT